MKKKIIIFLRYLICKLSGKNQHYWDMDRVCRNYSYSTSVTNPSNFKVKMSVPEGLEYNKAYSIEDLYNFKKYFTKKSIDNITGVAKEKIDYSEKKIPNYYIGKTYGYEARKVCEDFDLSYNVGTAVTYLLRAGKKEESDMTAKNKHIEDVQKALNHLEFEITKLKNES